MTVLILVENVPPNPGYALNAKVQVQFLVFTQRWSNGWSPYKIASQFMTECGSRMIVSPPSGSTLCLPVHTY